MVSVLLLVSMLAAPAVSTGDARGQARTPRPTADKADIFGSVTLVPTRAGERARAELAMAGEAARLVSRLPGVRDVALTARLEGETTISGVVVLEPDPPPDLTGVIASVAADVAKIPVSSVRITARAGAVAPRATGLPAPLGLAILGLGACLGILVERWRWQRRTADDSVRAARYR